MNWSRRVDLNHRSPGSKPGRDGQTPLRLDVLDHPAGLEPAASGFARRRSCPLSYGWKSAIVSPRQATARYRHPEGMMKLDSSAARFCVRLLSASIIGAALIAAAPATAQSTYP